MPKPVETSNILPKIWSVSEISTLLKGLLEESFPYVQIKGEISGAKFHVSGHLYFSIKDANSVLNCVCWRGVASGLRDKIADGLEVICTGSITAYSARSSYQLTVEKIEIAGEGALLKLLQERKEKFLKEGLFDPARKKPLPFLPRSIGVITSKTGAVIRDILHRLSDRFPLPVMLWPVSVQGEGSAEQIAEAIRGFNQLSHNKPDVLIVARGGGSIEDLWSFNEEIVIRAVAESEIPIISAVGHETDTTLIDFVSDRRAPTPTAAAEMAVPVKRDLIQGLADKGHRLHSLLIRDYREKRQRFDDATERLRNSLKVFRERCLQKLQNLSQLLESYSFHKTLERGFCLVRDDKDLLIQKVSQTKEGQFLNLLFQDGEQQAMVTKHKPTPKSRTQKKGHNQLDLL
ncbi:exodeoxyribonuclease VII large subunit [Candidatus Nucleicultrix amoebiphila]|jgi:exodeoxyribonuclease VII large subunit|uniref:Exodeoxyribonuclease 7 large subunit n=1 Tax=Candidatus Nucleicultrix amoebiphila FS5 TaxID=1414854 RepID=A0A1W6N547_9PROT|nr:exodeoxyribonuclease VII large subunit [Candidatus Nucleicultrix amoebiphila]ARN84994.1 hypothetical protein GQ61_06500 [Candidatus Nucleicultrix amoebiphila FS5]